MVTEMLSSREKALKQARIADEMQHRSRNLFSILTAIVRLSARGVGDVATLARRIAGTRVALLGEPANVQEYAIPSVGLTFHELATNAVKYGLLEVEKGFVHVDCRLAKGLFTIEWIERDRPQIDLTQPRRDGTGSRLSDKMLRAVRGNLEREFCVSGMKATLVLALNRMLTVVP